MNSRLLIFFLGFCHFFISQEIKSDRYSFTVYSKENGLVDNNINDLKMDKDGYLWLATDNGISRFDGANFINLNNTNSKLFFKNGVVNSIHICKNSLILSSKNAGLLILDRKTLKLKKLISTGVVSIAISGDTLAYVTNEGLLTVRTLKKVLRKRKITNSGNYSIAFWEDAVFVSIERKGLFKYSRNNLKTLGKNINAQNFEFGSLVKSKKNGLIVETDYYAYTVHENCELSLTKGLEKYDYISYYTENKAGKPVIVYRNKSPMIPYKNKLTSVYINSDDVEYELRKILPVNNSIYFISTNQGLIKQCLKKNISEQVSNSKIEVPNIIQVRRKIIEGKNNKLYFLGFPGIVEIDKKTKKSKKYLSESLSIYDGVWANSKIYFIVENLGVMTFSPNNYSLKHLEDSIIQKDDNYYSIASDEQNHIFLGGNHEIVIHDFKEKKSKSMLLPNQEKVNSLLFDSKTKKLLVGTTNGVYIYNSDAGKLKFKSKIKLYNKNVRSLLITKDRKDLFIGTENGLFSYNYAEKKITKEYTLQNGSLENNKICSILEDNFGKIWFSTFSDISVYNPETKVIYSLNKKNGVLNGEYNYKSAIKLQNGSMIFGGLNNYEMIKPKALMFKNELKEFYITSTQKRELLNNEVHLFGKDDQPSKISYDVLSEEVEISLSNLDYLSGNRYSFEYKIDEGLWNKTNDEQLILFANIPSGNHELSIRMIDPFGNVVKTKTILVVAWMPFYKTNSFITLILSIIILLTIGLRFVLKREMEKETLIKNRVAMDLHDETGTILTRLFLLVRRREQQPNERAEIQAGLKDALFSLRAFIDSMSKSTYSIEDLGDNKKELLTSSFLFSSIQSKLNISKDDNYDINVELYRDLKLCIYEGVNNCLKYSNANCFELSIIAEKKQLTIKMVDDGKLIDLSEIDSKGNGVRNIKKRTQRNNGICNFTINPNGHGLVIELKFPIR